MIKDFGYALETVLLLLNVFIVNISVELLLHKEQKCRY